MKRRDEQKTLTEGQGQVKKPRFTIEKLEERIAPSHWGWYGKDFKGQGPGRNNAGGHCGHGACK